ncbi:MAG: AAA family ATPase [Acidobacteria bacterium]|nr:AAA family ATPase [Acidobacteriota bacterium]
MKDFKLLHDVNLELRSRNVFIGPNKSGKSTILQLLQFLQRAVTDGDVKKTCDVLLGGFSEVLWKGVQPPGSIQISLEGQSPPDKTFQYDLVIRGDVLGRVVIEREKLTVNKSGTLYNLIDVVEGKGGGFDASGQMILRGPDPSRPALSYEIPGWEAGELRSYFLRWHFFNLLPPLSRATAGPAVGQVALDTFGGQLSAWLMTFQSNYKDEFARVMEVAKQAFPHLESFSAFLTPSGTTFLRFQESGMQSPVSIIHASDGELKFLALLSIIFSPFAIPLVCIEEPENYLHPRLLEMVVDIANQRKIELEGQVSQAFVTTHSPYLVDYLEPEDVVVVDRVGNEARFRRPANEQDLRELMRQSETSTASRRCTRRSLCVTVIGTSRRR